LTSRNDVQVIGLRYTLSGTGEYFTFSLPTEWSENRKQLQNYEWKSLP